MQSVSGEHGVGMTGLALAALQSSGPPGGANLGTGLPPDAPQVGYERTRPIAVADLDVDTVPEVNDYYICVHLYAHDAGGEHRAAPGLRRDNRRPERD